MIVLIACLFVICPDRVCRSRVSIFDLARHRDPRHRQSRAHDGGRCQGKRQAQRCRCRCRCTVDELTVRNSNWLQLQKSPDDAPRSHRECRVRGVCVLSPLRSALAKIYKGQFRKLSEGGGLSPLCLVRLSKAYNAHTSRTRMGMRCRCTATQGCSLFAGGEWGCLHVDIPEYISIHGDCPTCMP